MSASRTIAFLLLAVGVLHADTTVLKASKLTFSGKSRDAMELLKPLIAKRPPVVEAHIVYQRAYKCQDPKKMVLEYRKLFHENSQSPDFIYLYARLLPEIGQVEKAISLFRETEEIEPGHFHARRGRLIVWMIQKKFKEAHVLLDQLRRAKPKSFDLLFLKAHLLSMGMKREAAGEFWDDLTMAAGDDPFNLLNLSQLGIILGKPESVKIMRRLVQSYPNSPALLLAEAAKAGMRKQWDHVVSLAKKALDVEPNLAEAHRLLAIAYAENGMVDLARKEEAIVRESGINSTLVTAIESDGRTVSLRNSVLNIDSILENPQIPWKRGEFQTTLERVRKILRDHPESTLSREFYSRLLWRLGRQDEAIKVLSEIELSPPENRWMLHLRRAEMLYSLNKPADAAKAYSEVVRTYPWKHGKSFREFQYLASELHDTDPRKRYALENLKVFPWGRERGCGPYAVATALSYFGKEVTPESVSATMMKDGSSTTTEVFDAVRKQGFNTVGFVPTPELVKQYLNRGFPVLVLEMISSFIPEAQRMGISNSTIGHAWVVRGYDDNIKSYLDGTGVAPVPYGHVAPALAMAIAPDGMELPDLSGENVWAQKFLKELLTAKTASDAQKLLGEFSGWESGGCLLSFVQARIAEFEGETDARSVHMKRCLELCPDNSILAVLQAYFETTTQNSTAIEKAKTLLKEYPEENVANLVLAITYGNAGYWGRALDALEIFDGVTFLAPKVKFMRCDLQSRLCRIDDYLAGLSSIMLISSDLAKRLENMQNLWRSTRRGGPSAGKLLLSMSKNYSKEAILESCDELRKLDTAEAKLQQLFMTTAAAMAGDKLSTRTIANACAMMWKELKEPTEILGSTISPDGIMRKADGKTVDMRKLPGAGNLDKSLHLKLSHEGNEVLIRIWLTKDKIYLSSLGMAAVLRNILKHILPATVKLNDPTTAAEWWKSAEKSARWNGSMRRWELPTH
jgi:tetratricopeptide (TPR) repeat protein